MSKELLNLTNLFHKLATSGPKISVIENTDPVLKELSRIKDFDERVEFAKEQKGWKLLGTGSARAAFSVNQKLVLKVAINEKGISQNQIEMDPDMQTPCTAKIYAADGGGRWILFQATKTITEKRFKELTGMGFGSYCKALWVKFDNNSDPHPPNDFEEIENNPFFKCVCELVLKNNLLLGDLTESKISSYGEVDGKVKVRDFGMDIFLYQSSYADKSDNSSSSSSSAKSST